MKSILKALIVTGIAGAMFGALMRRLIAERMPKSEVPTVKPPSDAEPHLAEPLRESDLNVAQNSPF